jgi:hypothetical protein
MKIAGEYAGVSRELWRRGVGALAVSAHAMEVTPDEAQDIIKRLVPKAAIAFRGYRGRAKRSANRVTMPARGGVRTDGVPHLRLGIVLHECAHLLAWEKYGRGIRPHGEEFCIVFARLLREF